MHCGRLFARAGVVVRSPGRINLVGDHTDYNDGLAMPMAIDRELGFAGVPNDDQVVRLWSEFDDVVHELPLEDIGGGRWPSWTVYVQGVLRLRPGGPPRRGFDAAVASDLPHGAGLSSSAALELATIRAVDELTGVAWDPAGAARLGRRVENDWVGVATGIMDQLTVAHASRGAALLLDCRDATWVDVELPGDIDVVVLDTGARRELVGSAYDDRRADCRRAAELLGVPSLRELPPDWQDGMIDLPAPLVARVRHVITENQRVRDLATALSAGDVSATETILRASHASLRADYEVSGPELDTMAELANDTPGILGARMTGGGFAGACVALAIPDEPDLDGLLTRYREIHDLPARAMVVTPVGGTSLQ